MIIKVLRKKEKMKGKVVKLARAERRYRERR